MTSTAATSPYFTASSTLGSAGGAGRPYSSTDGSGRPYSSTDTDPDGAGRPPLSTDGTAGSTATFSTKPDLPSFSTAPPTYGMNTAGTGTRSAWAAQNAKPGFDWETWLSLAFALVVFALWAFAIYVSFRRNRGFRALQFLAALFCCPCYLMYTAAVPPPGPPPLPGPRPRSRKK